MMDNETLVLLSEYSDEWYQTTYTCSCCGCEFMTDEHPEFCPGCGKKIIGEKQEKMTVYDLKGDE